VPEIGQDFLDWEAKKKIVSKEIDRFFLSCRNFENSTI
jgi:hypothetical protein